MLITIVIIFTYRLFHGFRICLFCSQFWLLMKQAWFFYSSLGIIENYLDSETKPPQPTLANLSYSKSLMNKSIFLRDFRTQDPHPDIQSVRQGAHVARFLPRSRNRHFRFTCLLCRENSGEGSSIKLSLHIRFPNAFTAMSCNFFNLPWFCLINVSNKKLQRNAENACGNRMCKDN